MGVYGTPVEPVESVLMFSILSVLPSGLSIVSDRPSQPEWAFPIAASMPTANRVSWPAPTGLGTANMKGYDFAFGGSCSAAEVVEAATINSDMDSVRINAIVRGLILKLFFWVISFLLLRVYVGYFVLFRF